MNFFSRFVLGMQELYINGENLLMRKYITTENILQNQYSVDLLLLEVTVVLLLCQEQ